MPTGLFRIRDRDGSFRLAAGDADSGPTALLPDGFTIDAILADPKQFNGKTVRVDKAYTNLVLPAAINHYKLSGRDAAFTTRS